jgi:hypothetical protein
MCLDGGRSCRTIRGGREKKLKVREGGKAKSFRFVS